MHFLQNLLRYMVPIAGIVNQGEFIEPGFDKVVTSRGNFVVTSRSNFVIAKA